MLNALGLASAEQREKYKELKKAYNRCRRDIEALSKVTDDLRSAYDTHKGDCALGRYEALKKMVKEARSRYKTVAQKRNNDPERHSYKCSGLRQELKAFALRASLIARMSSGEMAIELEKMNQKLNQLRRQYSVYEEAQEKLYSDYECSKRHTPPVRYYMLKDMVKVATRVKQ